MYYKILIKLFNEFKQCLQDKYIIKLQWKHILNIIKSITLWHDVQNTVSNKSYMKLLFKICFTYYNDLIYYIDNINDQEHLCILLTLKKDIWIST